MLTIKLPRQLFYIAQNQRLRSIMSEDSKNNAKKTSVT